MPRRRNRRQDLDFAIHVDSSCMTAPLGDPAAMEHDDPTAKGELAAVPLPGHEGHDGPPFEEEQADPADAGMPEGPAQGPQESVAGHAAERPEQQSVVRHRDAACSDASAGPDDAGSRRGSEQSSASHSTSRRASDRTEALAHAIAREIVTQMGSRGRESGGEPRRRAAADDSSSHHENDDVFSDDSPRSSMGSMSEAEQTKIEQTLSQRNITQRPRVPRISDLPPSDHDDFIPTVRGTPRPPFRSPSSVQALQMASPTASALGGATPRSSRRTPLPTVSRLGSPSVSAQYSPKKTPPRFRRATPPLVLLHVTLLPLRWPWGGVLEAAAAAALSREAKALREAWRQLQDRTGDTVSDRGVLLPHPQSDYEVLEERLLEALELPLRRRARILECGHYLGPANDMSLGAAADSDDDDDQGDDRDDDGARSPRADQKHWCCTCRSDIRYDSLGEGRVFRVKVYASNGLMRAGAWEACWKEMERVDVELEPIVDAGLQDELAALAAEHERALELEHADDDDENDDDEEEHDHGHGQEESFVERARSPEPSPSPRPESCVGSPPAAYEDRRARDEVDEERLREIHGASPRAHAEAHSPYAPDVAAAQETPSAAAKDRHQQAYRGDSLPELMMEALKVLMQDKKNVMIGLLGALAAMLALRGSSGPQPGPAALQTVVREAPEVLLPLPETPRGVTTGLEMRTAADPCASPAVEAPPQLAQPSTVRVVESVTKTVRETTTETVRETLTETETVLVETVPTPSRVEAEAVAEATEPAVEPETAVEAAEPAAVAVVETEAE